MRFLAVNYHHVDDPDQYEYPGIHPVSPVNFEKQLMILGQHFDFVSQEDILAALQGQKDLPLRSCLITFDDGLKCQYEKALPILDKLKIPALFFVTGIPYDDPPQACLVHKIHYLRARMDPDLYYKKCESLYYKITHKRLLLESLDENKVARQYRYDQGREAKLKYWLNYVLDPKTKHQIINTLFQELVKDEANFCREFYLSREMLKEMAKRSLLGLHSFSHLPLKKLDPKVLNQDLEYNIRGLKKVIGDYHFNAISYPYGNTESVSLREANLAERMDLKFGFTMERSFNTSLRSPLLLARIDTNDAPGGKAPCFLIDKNHKITILPNRHFTEKRMMYYQE
ncbi:MAG: polysaccharide deacetylase family protein [Spirochaetes bacterium]|nr:polysaccharide deacetylase family protein [Spirochaetota bacterium]